MDDPVSPFSYMLGSVILHWDEEEQRLDVVNGQQRLLTLAVLLELLESRSAGRDLAAAPGLSEDPKAPIVVVRQRMS